MLHQYLYISTAPQLSRDEVDSILAVSGENNPAKGITGFLIYNGRNFLQLIEGEKSALDALMAKINEDPRNSGVSMLDQREISERACPNWAMKRVLIVDSVERRRELLEKELPSGLSDQMRKIITNFAMLN